MNKKIGFWSWFFDNHFGIVLGVFVVSLFIGAMLFMVYGMPILVYAFFTLPDIVIGIVLFSALGISITLLCLSFWWEYKDDIVEADKE